jgi:hypothetical protein
VSVSAAEASTWRLRISRITVVALALASAYFVLHTIISVMWAPAGDFGFGIDRGTAVVNDLAPRNVAKGIRIGDRVDLAAMHFRERGYLYEDVMKPVGWRMTVPVSRGGQHQTAEFEIENTSLPLDNVIWAWLKKVVATVFIATGVILVWNRPSVMLWGLAVFLIQTHGYVVGPLRSPAVAALILLSYGFISSLGLPGIVVFAARFPSGRASSVTKYWDIVAGSIFVCFFCWHIHDFIPLFTARPIGDLPDAPMTIFIASAYVLVFVALCVKTLKQKRSPRASLGWIVAGYGVGVVLGYVALSDLFDVVDFDSYWPLIVQQILVLALPASVAYSVIRHRAFDLGYLANRTLVYSVLLIGTGSTFLIGVWTAALIPSPLALGTSMFIALLAGMAFQAQHARAVRFVDRLFLPHRHAVAESLDRIGEHLLGGVDPKRLTDEVASTLGLASVAVFARANDGGFVRTAACGWPEGTAWHFLPGETVTRSLDAGTSIIAFPDAVDATDEEAALPVSHARPRIALTLRRGDRVERAILVGAYRDGASLDRDAIRSLHGIFDGALVA